MAAVKNKAVKKYLVKVSKVPNYCGIGAGGVQFANGQAVIDEGTILNWFKEHEGYEVSEIEAGREDKQDGEGAGEKKTAAEK